MGMSYRNQYLQAVKLIKGDHLESNVYNLFISCSPGYHSVMFAYFVRVILDVSLFGLMELWESQNKVIFVRLKLNNVDFLCVHLFAASRRRRKLNKK